MFQSKVIFLDKIYEIIFAYVILILRGFLRCYSLKSDSRYVDM